MVNFELRIYVIPAENIDEVIENNGIHDTSDLTDTQFVKVAEELGTVYTLGKFLNLDVIAPDTDVIRAFFIDKDNEDTAPVRADGYETTITASKITCTAPTNNGQSLEFNHVLYDDSKQVATVQVKEKIQRVFEDTISTELLRIVEPNTDVDVINIYCESDLDYLLDTLNENQDEFDKEDYEVDKETLESYKGRFDSNEIWQLILTDC
jgi:hypothetical protein